MPTDKEDYTLTKDPNDPTLYHLKPTGCPEYTASIKMFKQNSSHRRWGARRYNKPHDPWVNRANRADAIDVAMTLHVPPPPPPKVRWDLINQLPKDILIYGNDHMRDAPLPLQIWQDALNHKPAYGQGYCQTCGPTVTCLLLMFYEAVMATTVRELDRMGALIPEAEKNAT